MEHQGNSRTGHSGKLQQSDTACEYLALEHIPVWHQQLGIFILVDRLKQGRPLRTACFQSRYSGEQIKALTASLCSLLELPL